MDSKIKSRLIMHYSEVASKYGEDNLIGVFLYGSQNYNVSTDNSDVDSIALVIPNFKQLVLDTPKNEEIDMMPIFGVEGHCVVKDIRIYAKELRKCSTMAFEILFTDYFLLNPAYEELWQTTFPYWRETIVTYNPVKTLKAMAGNALRNLELGTSKGQAAAYRLGCSIEKYQDKTNNYKSVLEMDNIIFFFHIKEGKGLSPYREDFFKSILALKEDTSDKAFKENIDKVIDNIILNFVKKKFSYGRI
jgi:hypothetical protein